MTTVGGPGRDPVRLTVSGRGVGDTGRDVKTAAEGGEVVEESGGA